MSTSFGYKEYDVTNLCDKFCPLAFILTLGSHQKRLLLEPEEAVLVTKDCCNTATERRPYGELESVDKLTSCGICATFNFGGTPISPGCGCSEQLVDEIVTELKARMKARGDTGQIRRAEQQLREIQVVSPVARTTEPACGRSRPRSPTSTPKSTLCSTT